MTGDRDTSENRWFPVTPVTPVPIGDMGLIPPLGDSAPCGDLWWGTAAACRGGEEWSPTDAGARAVPGPDAWATTAAEL